MTRNIDYSIQTRDLSLWYGDFRALSGITFDIESGQVTSLIGPSGCGKTTLLRSFNRINERFGSVRTEGEIRIFGKNIHDPDVALPELRKAVGMVFQRPNPLPISIAENILFGLRVHSPHRKFGRAEAAGIVESALLEVGLWDDLKDRLNSNAASLLLDQQQKLCIARLLPLKPEIILMDEPCSALDVAGTESIEEMIRRLRGRHTIVIVTHNMAQARRASDHAAFMLLGEIVEHAPTSRLFTTPADGRTAEYIEGRFG